MKPFDEQVAIYGRLRGWAPLAALVGDRIIDESDRVAHLPSTSIRPAMAYPFISIGEASRSDWSTDDSTGIEAVLTIHIWDKPALGPGEAQVSLGFRRTKQIAAEVYAALNRYSLPIDGTNVVLCDFESDEYMIDPDGRTRHAVQRYRILYE